MGKSVRLKMHSQPFMLSKRTSPSKLSIVIPIYNEEASIPLLHEELTKWRQDLPIACEVILVDDGSKDASELLIRQWVDKDNGARAVFLSRNFGHQNAVTAGLEYARGDAIVIMDADLQDPLSVINEMLERYQEGYDIVYGHRIKRMGESQFKRTTAAIFYRLMKQWVQPNLPTDCGDFRLVSRRCLDTLLRMKETHRFLRGMFAWTGYHQCAVDYVRHPRKKGDTKYSFSRMFRLAWNAMLSFTTLPIQIISVTGLFTAGFGFTNGAYSTIRWWFWQDTVPGWTTIIVLLCLMGGVILISLGIIGEYIGRIYEEVKHRPLFVVRDLINIE